ncbi:helix-turn-helix domain-containing protein [Chitinimonas taiwanensis]|uniref:helix-turn-helix domain-containing protein n=1 Tax=Chitinimonas taiwanensis TaxID=240412 RepID=UPI0035B36EEA
MSTLDIKGAAELLNVHENTVLTLAAEGDIPGAKIGRAWVFIEDDLIVWLRLKTKTQTEARRREVEASTRPARPVRRHRRDLPELP